MCQYASHSQGHPWRFALSRHTEVTGAVFHSVLMVCNHHSLMLLFLFETVFEKNPKKNPFVLMRGIMLKLQQL